MVTKLSIDQASLKRIIRKLEEMPKNLRNNALRSATTAGASVVRDRARALAPACMKASIKTVRRRGKNGRVITSVIAGNGRSANSSLADTAFAGINRVGGGDTSSKRMQRKLEQFMCPPAFWVEFGTYQNRDLKENPYSPETFRRHPAYRRLGHTDSPYWNPKHNDKWMPARPFMRPALDQSGRDGSVERAMAKKINEYIEKYEGVKK